ncbi:putative phage tail protein [Aeromonas enteropelogenes]|uniref:putative phage tail protein n=1 Tax=Aeromonas enteropelogenes TaxID=29489 RepID=UPI003B9E05AC
MAVNDEAERPARPAEAYQLALLGLMPRGLAWDNSPDGEMGQLMLAMGDSLARADADKVTLSTRERYPGSAVWLLPDWEQFLGLPECVNLEQTIAERQRVAQNKMQFYGSLNKGFYRKLAAAYGYEIEVTPDPDNQWISDVHIYSELTWRDATVLDPVTTPLRVFNISDLECVFERYWPAHQGIAFIYEDGE